MNLDRMLHKCKRDQWQVGDLDWTRPPPELSRDTEEAVCQYFTDMAVIERLAAALFIEQGRRTDNPVLAEIFETFVRDELRHAHVAQMLADHYDVHHYRTYKPNPSLLKFFPHFVHAVRFLSAEFANLYITTGELILDVALLRSLDDYVDDAMSAEAMQKINRDESRHIAIDFHMVEYYSSPAWQEALDREPTPPLRTQLQAWWAFANVLRHARPFFRAVFFEPMRRTDPSGRRIREAFKRIQLLSAKPQTAARPFAKFLLTLQDIHNDPILGRLLGRLMVRILGIDPDVVRVLYTDEEYARARTMTYDDLAAESLQLKYT